jgi:glycosyltransferase involved in cell wall biosynthesis
MATYKDFHGVYFTVQALRWYQDLGDAEILVVDNFGCQATENFCQLAGVRYQKYTEVQGTAAPRDKVFELAQGTHVVCMDSHVLLAPGAVARLRKFYAANPDSDDLYQGPLQYDRLNEGNVATEFNDVWSNGMWGRWHCRENVTDETTPFEILSQGLGFFTCRKDAWLGFNPLFRGFGGEEGYLHAKFRKAGKKCWCLPWLRWAHRFGRPEGIPYPLAVSDKFRNHLLGFVELGMDTAPVLQHFQSLVDQATFARVVTEVLQDAPLPVALPAPVPEVPPPPPRPPVMIREDGVVMGQLPQGVVVRTSGVVLGARKPSRIRPDAKISCVMRTYGRAHLPYRPIDEAVESFLRQDYPNRELLILNDTPGQWLTFSHPLVKVINLAEKIDRLGYKSNIAVRLTDGEIVAIWDDDDVHLPGRLRTLADKLEDYESVGPSNTWFQGEDGGLRAAPCGFHFGIFSRAAFDKVGGYPDDAEADADQKLAARLHRRVIDFHPAQFVSIYRWNPGHPHLSYPDRVVPVVRSVDYARGRFQIKPVWLKDYSEEAVKAMALGVAAPRSVA